MPLNIYSLTFLTSKCSLKYIKYLYIHITHTHLSYIYNLSLTDGVSILKKKSFCRYADLHKHIPYMT